MSDVRQFNLALQKFVSKEVPDQMVTVQRKVCLDALAKLVKRTPVDTGRARGGWQVGINQRPPETERLDKNGSKTIGAGRNVIGSIKKPTVCFIVNDVEYIVELEKGRSKQCPPGGMMALTVQELKDSLR